MSGLLRRTVVDTRPLSHPDFRRLCLGQGVSFVGFQLTSVAVPVEVYTITRSSLWVGLLGLASLVPLIIFGLWGGTVADAVDRRRLLLISSVLTWAATFGLLVQSLLRLDSITVIFGLIVVQSIGFAISSPTRSAIVPRLVPETLVPSANTLNFMVSSFGTVAGPLIAGAVLGHLGYAGAYAIDAALFTAGLYAAIRLPRLPPLGEHITRPGLRSLLDGLKFIGVRPVLVMSFVVDIIAMVFAMPKALFPQIAAERFGGVDATGWLYSSIALGSLVAGLASGWIGRVARQGIALVIAIFCWGIAVAAAGLSHHLWLTVLLLAVGGGADLISAVYRQTILQTYAPDEMRGRMQGVFTVVVAGGPRLADLRAGAMASVTGLTAAWVGGGIACAIAVLAALAAVPALRHYRYTPRSPRPTSPTETPNPTSNPG
ncbi:MAG TPA: MFS transporter [Streptosporangiaceae bacterium]